MGIPRPFASFSGSVKRSAVLALAAICLATSSIAAESASLFRSSLQTFEKRTATADPANWSFVFLGDNRGNDAKFIEILKRVRELNPLLYTPWG